MCPNTRSFPATEGRIVAHVIALVISKALDTIA
jgi:hypothetical protein